MHIIVAIGINHLCKVIEEGNVLRILYTVINMYKKYVQENINRNEIMESIPIPI